MLHKKTHTINYKTINAFCMSSYLAFRYVTLPNIGWTPNSIPKFPKLDSLAKYPVKNSKDLDSNLKQIISNLYKKYNPNRIGIMLSSGIDSAILASYLQPKTHAYTIKFIAPNTIDESIHAKVIAKNLNLNHHIVTVTWKDYKDNIRPLMLNKFSPLHPAEIGVYKAAKAAKKNGQDILIVGNGADSTFGGLDKLLSKDWTLKDFIDRYTFVNPKLVLNKPTSIKKIYETYRQGKNGINVQSFLKIVHGLGVIQMFENAMDFENVKMICPYEELFLDTPLDLNKVRSGEPKYILKELFKEIFQDIKALPKIAFARPMDDWLSSWNGPKRKEFRKDINISSLSGEQKWLLYCLEIFLNEIEKSEL